MKDEQSKRIRQRAADACLETRSRIHILHLSDDFDRGHSEFPIVIPGVLYAV